MLGVSTTNRPFAMPASVLPRRDFVLALAALAAAGACGRAAAEGGNGVEIRFAITREARQPSGEFAQRRFENSMSMAFGETMEIDFRDQYRVSMAPVDHGGSAEVQLWLWDNQDKGSLAGNGRVEVPFGDTRALTLLTSDNIRYAIALTALRRTLPPR